MKIRLLPALFALAITLNSALVPISGPIDDLADLPTQREPSTVRLFKKYPYVLGGTILFFTGFLLLNLNPNFRKKAKKAIAFIRRYIRRSVDKYLHD